MNLFKNKFFISVLLLTVTIYFLSALPARAEFVGDIFEAVINLGSEILDAAMTVINVVSNLVLASVEVFAGNLGLNFLFPGIIADGLCRFDHLDDTIFDIYAGQCEDENIAILAPASGSCSPNGGCGVPLTFYNPVMNGVFESTASECAQQAIDETQRDVQFYRFILPAENVTEDELVDWFYDIKNYVGSGHTNYQQEYNFVLNESVGYHDVSDDSGSYLTLPYSVCGTDNICRFLDGEAPRNSYVAYVAKILGNYNSQIYRTECYWPENADEEVCNDVYDCFSGTNKFLNKNDASDADFPSDTSLGNAIVGPFLTGDCPCVSISADPSTITVGDSSTLSWTSVSVATTSIDQGIGNVAVSGSTLVSPDADIIYTITGISPDGSIAQASTTVAVVSQQPGDCTLSLNGSAGCNYVPLSWTASAGAAGYRILRGSSRTDISPYQPYTARNYTDSTVSENTSYLYQIEAYNSFGTKRCNALNVTTPYCPPTVTLTAIPSSIYQGQSSTLNWTTSANITSCVASGAWSGPKTFGSGYYGEVVLPSPPPSAIYTLTCYNPAGVSASASVTIDISPLLVPDWHEIIPR